MAESGENPVPLKGHIMSKDTGKESGAEAEKNTAEIVDPAVLLPLLESKVALYKILLIGAFSLLLITLCILLPAYALLYSKASRLENASTETLDKSLEKLHQDFENLRTFREKEMNTIAELEARIEALNAAQKSRPITTMKTVFLERETDYQKLSDVLISGLEDLSGMVQGKRDWVTFYRNEITELKNRSQARAQVITSTLIDDNPAPASASVAEEAPATHESHE